MKRLLLATILSGCALGMIAQPVNRRVLIEEATNASCPPCAAQNPAFNANIVQPNMATDKLTAVKYQAWFPGFDPMYNQNSAELDERITYYGLQNIGVPTTALNGRVPDNNNTTGGGWSGYAGGPYGYTQAVVDAEYADMTPFTLDISHSFSNDLSTVMVTVTVTNVDVNAFSGSDMRLHVALLEEEIVFNTAPGTNGETEFQEVMRKMYPDALGTSIDDDWAASQTQTFNISGAIPSYLYNLTEISIAAWIQDNNTQEVWQSNYSSPIQIDGPDMGVTALVGSFTDYCAASVNPEVSVENAGTVPITSATFDVQINGNSVATENWTGNLAVGATANYTFTNAVTRMPGTNDMEIRISSVNGGVDINNANNAVFDNVSMRSATAMAYPNAIGFEGLAFGDLANNTYGSNPDGMTYGAISMGDVNGLTTSLGGFEQSNNSFFWYYYNAGAGQQASFVTDATDIMDAETASLKFSHAYAQYQAENDRLEVLISTDCGGSWTNIFDAQGSSLSTTAPTTAQFWPTADQWDSTRINLDAYVGNEVMFMFRGTSDFGNNLFVDDINIAAAAPVVDPGPDTTEVTIDGQTVYIIDGDTFELWDGEFVPLGVEETAEAAISVYPNPATDVVNIAGVNGIANVKIYDMRGRLVMNKAIESNVISVADLQTGIYQMSIESAGVNVIRRITVSR